MGKKRKREEVIPHSQGLRIYYSIVRKAVNILYGYFLKKPAKH